MLEGIHNLFKRKTPEVKESSPFPPGFVEMPVMLFSFNKPVTIIGHAIVPDLIQPEASKLLPDWDEFKKAVAPVTAILNPDASQPPFKLIKREGSVF